MGTMKGSLSSLLLIIPEVQDLNVFETPVKREFTFQATLHKDLTSAGSRGRDFG